jgi:hypothetical protein
MADFPHTDSAGDIVTFDAGKPEANTHPVVGATDMEEDTRRY